MERGPAFRPADNAARASPTPSLFYHSFTRSTLVARRRKGELYRALERRSITSRQSPVSTQARIAEFERVATSGWTLDKVRAEAHAQDERALAELERQEREAFVAGCCSAFIDATWPLPLRQNQYRRCPIPVVSVIGKVRRKSRTCLRRMDLCWEGADLFWQCGDHRSFRAPIDFDLYVGFVRKVRAAGT